MEKNKDKFEIVGSAYQDLKILIGKYAKESLPVLFIGEETRTAPLERTAPETHRMMEIFGSASL